MAGWKKLKGLAREYMCITHGHSQQCGDGQREEGRELEAKAKEGHKDICSSAKSKNKIEK